ncbi:MAG: hypothetical protein ACM3VS_16565 [Candidatus Dadabacteria bacterium]
MQKLCILHAKAYQTFIRKGEYKKRDKAFPILDSGFWKQPDCKCGMQDWVFGPDLGSTAVMASAVSIKG